MPTSAEMKKRYSYDPAAIEQQLLSEGYTIEEPPSWVDDEQRKKEEEEAAAELGKESAWDNLFVFP